MVDERGARCIGTGPFYTLLFMLSSCLLFAQEKEGKLLRTEEIRIRDPYIFADSATQQYYMYAQMDNRRWGRKDTAQSKGVEVYVSSDLKHWELPKPVLVLSDTSWAREKVWAPEMHSCQGKFYLFVTLTGSKLCPNLLRFPIPQTGQS